MGADQHVNLHLISSQALVRGALGLSIALQGMLHFQRLEGCSFWLYRQLYPLPTFIIRPSTIKGGLATSILHVEDLVS